MTDTSDELTMGERLGIAIKQTGWTQSRLARKIAGAGATPEKINSEKSNINGLIRRKSKHSALSARYAEILKIDRDWLENGTSEIATTIVAYNRVSNNNAANMTTNVDNSQSFGLSLLKGYMRMTDSTRQQITVTRIENPTQQVAVIGCTVATVTYQIKGSDFAPVLQNDWLISVDPSKQAAAGEWLLIERNDSTHALILFSFEKGDCITGQDVLTEKTVSIDKADIHCLNPVLGILMPSQLLSIGD